MKALPSQTNKILTLVLLISQETQEILLGMKKRGFGVGKWNGFGGKVSQNETIFQGAQRELQEEANISCTDLRFRGLITFEFEGNRELYQVHIFKGTKFEGIIAESEEMRPVWFKIQEIPYDFMWLDDKIWLPKLLKDEIFVGNFLFQGESAIISYDLQEVSYEELLEKQKQLINFPLE